MLEQTIRGTESGLSPNGVDSFHTPNTTGLDGGSNSRKALKKRQMWQTPTVVQVSLRSDESWEKKRTSREKTGRKTLPPGTLQEQVMISGKNPCWDWSQSPINQAVRDRFPTPTAHNSKECNSPSEQNRNTPTLATHAGGKLNPTWVEWLMGWPLAWTDLKPLEMGKSHSVPQQLGES